MIDFFFNFRENSHFSKLSELEIFMKINFRLFACYLFLFGVIASETFADYWIPGSGSGYVVRSAKIDSRDGSVTIRVNTGIAATPIYEFKYLINYSSPASIALGNQYLSLGLTAMSTAAETYFLTSTTGSGITSFNFLSVQVGHD